MRGPGIAPNRLGRRRGDRLPREFIRVGGGAGLNEVVSTRIPASAGKAERKGSAVEMIFAATVTSGFLRRVAGTPRAPHGTALAPHVTNGSFA